MKSHPPALKEPTISLCMIARNEAPVIGRALQSAAKFVDEIIVVDTGSDDGTQDIARAHGARVVDFAWCDDFAAARNVYLREATCDWILVLDADEALDAAAPAMLEPFLTQAENDGKLCCYWLRELSHMDDSTLESGLAGAPVAVEHYILRMFPRRPELKYHGVIHEQLVYEGGSMEMRAVPAVLHHYGYSTSELLRKDRNERNLPLLRKAVDAAGDDAYAAFNLGSHLQQLARWDEAVEHLSRSKTLAPPPGLGGKSIPYMGSRAVALALCLWKLGRAEEAICELQAAVQDFPGMPDAPLHLGGMLVSRDEHDSAEVAFRQAIALGDAPLPSYFGLSDSGAGTWKPRLQLGMSLGRRGRWQDALPWLESAHQMAPGLMLATLALGLCHYHLEQYPHALRTWSAVDIEKVATPDILCRISEAHVRCGNLAPALQAATRAAERFPEDADAQLARARVMVEAGDGFAALKFYEEALAVRPDAAGWLEMGEVAAQMLDLDRARVAFEHATKLAPERPEPLNNLGALALNTGHLAAAKGFLGQVLRQNPEYDPAAWNLARVHILEKDPRRALALLRKRLHLGERRIADMMMNWQLYISGVAAHAPVKHDPVPGILLAATAAIRVGETNDAVAWLDALEKAGGPPDGVLPLRIEAERARNMLDSALMASLRWMEACPGQVGPIQEASELLMGLGRYEEAARLLDAVLSAA